MHARRFVALASVLLAAPVFVSIAFAQCCGQPPIWPPISGRVTDAVTGGPIAGARVTYSGRGDVLNHLGGEPINPPSVHGEVRTRADGTFVLPQLAQGTFEVRVSAPGYLSARQFLSEKPAGTRPLPPRPLPEAFCMARYGKPNCTAPTPPDGDFALQPTSVEVRQMGSAAQAAFGVQAWDLLQLPIFQTVAFSMDGERLALLGIVPDRTSTGVLHDCEGWIYDVSKDESQRIEPKPPAEFCENTPQMHWEGDAVILKMTEGMPPSGKIETIRWQDGLAEAEPVETLKAFPSSGPEGFQAHDDETVMDWTDDGEFLVVEVSEDCRQCDQTVVLSRQRDWREDIENSLSGYLLDHAHDQLVTVQLNRGQRNAYSAGLRVLDLKSHQARTFLLPAMLDPKLLAEQWLGDGGMAVAYTVQGACDRFGPTAPYDPPAWPGGPPSVKRSVCIARLPAEKADAGLGASAHR